MRSDKMSSIYSAEVRNEFTTPDHHARMRRGCLLFRGVLARQSSSQCSCDVHSGDKHRQGIAGRLKEALGTQYRPSRRTYTNGRISGLDLWILPNFLDFWTGS